MPDYILFMHNDATDDAIASSGDRWNRYFTMLNGSGAFEGGSSIGDGVCMSRVRPDKPVSAHLTGFIRVRAESLDAARSFVEGNPVYDAGGTVEIRLLPED